MNEQELRQRAVLAALPECIRFATDNPRVFNVGTGSRIITDEAMRNAVNNAVKIAEYLIDELKEEKK